MPQNNTLLMLGLGAAALFLLRNRGASEENQAPQLAGAAMMAAGEGTAPDAPFQQYSAPANPIFFFNQGGEMAQIPETNVPRGASSDEDIGTYPGGSSQPELEFTVERSTPTPSTTDISPINPVFSGSGDVNVIPATVWDDQAQIAEANFMPLLAIQETNSNQIEVIGSNVDISNLSSKEQFRAINVSGDEPFTTTAVVLSEYVQGFNPASRDQYGNIGGSNQFDPVAAAGAQIPGTNIPRGASSDEDIGIYPGGSNQPELEFTVERSTPTPSTTDISPINPVFSGSDNVNVIPSTVWDEQAQIAKANFMPLLAVTEGNGNLLGLSGSDADISNLSSKEQFRAINVSGDEPFTTTAVVLSEYVQGFTQDADLGRTTSNLRDQFGNIGGSNQFDPAAAANAIVISQTSSIFEDTHVARWDYSE